MGGLKVDTGYGKNAAAGLPLSSGISPLFSVSVDMLMALSSSILAQWAIKKPGGRPPGFVN
jgi:hypothetical protein